MENIIIVDALSTGKNYISDIIKRGYQPVVLETRILLQDESNPAAEIAYKKIRAKYANRALCIREQEKYEDTLEQIRQLRPLLVLPGSESGVPLAIRLADDLGLKGNPYERLPYYVKKQKMQEALAEHGLRSIKGVVVYTVDEALKFYRNEHLNGCVIKPVRGASSVGVHLCDSEEEMCAALEQELGVINEYAESYEGVCIQERIRGREYIVNTVSYDGVHRLSSILYYGKKKVEGGGNVYDYARTQNRLETGETRLVRYAFDTLDAIGIRYGAVHGEYMVDEKGPVLIEVNCRVMGGGISSSFLDRIWDHHETDNVLDTYLNPDWHDSAINVPYRAQEYGGIKYLVIPEDMQAASAPIMSIVRRLRSFHAASLGNIAAGFFPRTVDMDTVGGLVYLAHKEEQVLLHDLEFLRRTEMKYCDMLLRRDNSLSLTPPDRTDTVTEVLQSCVCSRSVLVVTNDPTLEAPAMVVQEEELSKALSGYNWGVLDLNYRSNEDIETIIETFYELAAHVRKGGHIIVPERTWWHLPCGMESVEILCEAAGLRIEAPTYQTSRIVMITVE